MRFLLLLLLFGLMGAFTAGTGAEQSASRARCALGSEDMTAIAIPSAIRSSVAADLEYDETETMLGVRVDLDGDRVNDYIIQSARRLCGNGGCPYAVVDGASRRDLGRVFGSSLYIGAGKTHGHSIVEAYAHSSVSSIQFATYRFDGRTYVDRTPRTVEGAAMTDLLATLNRARRCHPSGRG